MKRMNLMSAGALLALPLFACASYPAPTDHLANSYANIRAAQEVGASASPQAALHVKLAQEEQAKAKQLVADGKNEEADYMTMRANSDAELAIAISREGVANGKAADASSREHVAAQNAVPVTPMGPTSVSATTTTTSTSIPTSTGAK